MNQFLLVFIQIKSDSSKDLNRIAQYWLFERFTKGQFGETQKLNSNRLNSKKEKNSIIHAIYWVNKLC